MNRLSRWLLLALLAAGLYVGMAQVAITQSGISLVSTLNWSRGQGKIEDITICSNGTEAWVASIGPGALDDLMLQKLTGIDTGKPALDGDAFLMFGDNDDFGPGPGVFSPSLGDHGTGLPAGTGPRGYPGMDVSIGCNYAYIPNLFLDSTIKVDLARGAEATATNESGSVNQDDGTILWPAHYEVTVITDGGSSDIDPALRTMGSPVDAKLNTAETKLLVSASADNAVYVLDAATGAVLKKVETGGVGPGSLFVVGNSYAVVAQASRDLACFDLQNYRVSTISGLGTNPFMVVGSSDESRLYVSNQGTNTVTVLEGSGCVRSVMATIEVGTAPRHMALSADDRFLYVSNSLDNSVSIIDTESLSVVETLQAVAKTEPAPVGVVAVSHNNRYLYVFWEGGLRGTPGRMQIRVFDVSALY